MLSVLEGLFIFVAASESVLGVLGDGFIGTVYFIEFVKNKKVSMIGFILTGLAISRICLILLIIIDGFNKIFFPDMYASSTLIDHISYGWTIINQSSVWFATSLSMFYFLKIANFSQRVFLWLKSRTNKVLPLLMGSLLISWLITFPQVIKVINDNRMKKVNTTWQFSEEARNQFLTNQFLFSLGVFVFFLLTLITSFLLIISLWKHRRQMQLNITRFRDPSTEAHMKAMKILISFIILFILYFIGITIEILCSTVTRNKLLFLFGLSTTTIYPWGHSLILILGNSTLKQYFLRALQQFKRHEQENPSRTQ
ncbi:taste receptor type 2 member 10 [Erinaceus europaeus]|uniref:Taste receptor type 2 n=1 Tax=Erinaceus europaeus TaxID=9365 RepID=A0A1S2Z9C8_ERIEU|nr:taste receptor type 2 member 10 [Erinaceus europaeus]